MHQYCDATLKVLVTDLANHSRQLADMEGSSADLVYLDLPGHKSCLMCPLYFSLPVSDIHPASLSFGCSTFTAHIYALLFFAGIPNLPILSI